MELNKINDKTPEGRLLLMAVAALTVSPAISVNGKELDGRQITPMDMLDRLNEVAREVYLDQPVEEFEAAARPLMKYLAENHHPHHTAIVNSSHAELLEGVRSTAQITEYIKD